MNIFRPIQQLADFVAYGWFGISRGTYLGDTVNFFINDIIKIGLLLVFINYLMAVVRYYFPMEKVRDVFSKRRWFGLDYLLAALLGVITPFCSCSSIPLFIGFVGAGIPLGVTFAFLISSPLVNESSLYLFPAIFGMKVTVLYNLVGVAIAILGGILIQKLHIEKYVKYGDLGGQRSAPWHGFGVHDGHSYHFHTGRPDFKESHEMAIAGSLFWHHHCRYHDDRVFIQLDNLA